MDFCSKRGINYCKPNVSDVIHFLMQLYDNGLSYSTLNKARARSAVSAVAQSTNGNSVGSHPLVSRILKGVYQSHTLTPKYNHIWDVSIVLNYLSTLHTVDAITLKNLTLKLLMLLLLVTGKRGQTIHMLSLGGMTLTESYCVLQTW